MLLPSLLLGLLDEPLRGDFDFLREPSFRDTSFRDPSVAIHYIYERPRHSWAHICTTRTCARTRTKSLPLRRENVCVLKYAGTKTPLPLLFRGDRDRDFLDVGASSLDFASCSFTAAIAVSRPMTRKTAIYQLPTTITYNVEHALFLSVSQTEGREKKADAYKIKLRRRL